MEIHCKQMCLAGLAAATAVSNLACAPEMVRIRAAGERPEDRPERALIIGEFKIVGEGVPDSEIGVTAHQVYAGPDRESFRDLIRDRHVFAFWMYPGVFCYGQPTAGNPPKILGGKPACVEISEPGKAYYIGATTWKITKEKGKYAAELSVDDKREATMGSQLYAGVYPDSALVSQDVDPVAASAQYKVKKK